MNPDRAQLASLSRQRTPTAEELVAAVRLVLSRNDARALDPEEMHALDVIAAAVLGDEPKVRL